MAKRSFSRVVKKREFFRVITKVVSLARDQQMIGCFQSMIDTKSGISEARLVGKQDVFEAHLSDL